MRKQQLCVCVFTLSLSPLVWAELQRSLPARSTRFILLVILWSCCSPSTNSVCGEGRENLQLLSESLWLLKCLIFKNSQDFSSLHFATMETSPYFSLSHNQGEDRVRSGTFVIHSCSCCGSLLVAQLQPSLNTKAEKIYVWLKHDFLAINLSSINVPECHCRSSQRSCEEMRRWGILKIKPSLLINSGEKKKKNTEKVGLILT